MNDEEGTSQHEKCFDLEMFGAERPVVQQAMQLSKG